MSEPSRKKGIGTMLSDANTFIFEKNKKATTIVGTLLIILLTFGVFLWEANSQGNVLGRDDILKIYYDESEGSGVVSDLPEIRGYVEKKETVSASNSLTEGQSDEIPIGASDLKVIRKVDVTLTWTDEPDIRRIRTYENQPDTFNAKIVDPTGKTLGDMTSANTRESSGTITLSMDLDDATMIDYKGKGPFTIQVTLVEAGDYEPRLGLNLMSINDNSNDYSLTANVVFYDGSGV